MSVTAWCDWVTVLGSHVSFALLLAWTLGSHVGLFLWLMAFWIAGHSWGFSGYGWKVSECFGHVSVGFPGILVGSCACGLLVAV